MYTEKEIRKMDKTQLLFYFLVTRDNLVSVKRALFQRPEEENLKTIFDEESKNYDMLLNEIYRRMNYGRNKR